MTTPAASWLWGFVVCRCAVCAVSDAECLLGRIPQSFARNSPVTASMFEVETLEFCGFWGATKSGRQGITCGIGGCVGGGGAFATVVLVSAGGAPDP